MAILWALVTAITFAIADVIVGRFCKRKSPVFVSLPITAGILLFFLLASGLGPGIKMHPMALQFGLPIGILYALANVIFYKAMAIGPMATVSMSCSLAPLVPIGFDLLTGKPPTPLQAAGFLLIAAGLWLVAFKRTASSRASGLGINPFLLAIPAALLYGVIDVLFELASSTDMLALLLVIQAAKLIATLLLALPTIQRFSEDQIPILKLLPIGVIYGIGWITLYTSARQGSIDITSSLEYSSPLFIAILAYLFLAERLSRRQGIGFIASLLGVAFLVAPRHQPTPTSSCDRDCHALLHHSRHGSR